MSFDAPPPASLPRARAAPAVTMRSTSPLRDAATLLYPMPPGVDMSSVMVRDASAPNTEALLGAMRSVTAVDELAALKAEVTRLHRRLLEEEAAHADSLRRGQDSLRTLRAAYDKRVDDLTAELAEAKADAARERDTFTERVEAMQVEHMHEVHAERRLGEERLQQMSTDSTDALNAVQDQVASLNEVVDTERKKAQASVLALVEAKKTIEAGRDEADTLQKELTRLKDTTRQTAARDAARAAEADVDSTRQAEEMGRLKATIAQLDRSMRELDERLSVETKCREAAELQCLKAEKLVQEVSSNATASELRAIESQREVAIKTRELLAKDQMLISERDRLASTEAHLSTEKSCRKFAERFGSTRSALSATIGQVDPLLPAPYSAGAPAAAAGLPAYPNAYLQHPPSEKRSRSVSLS